MQPFEIEARESIRDIVARYNACGDAGRTDDVLALFAPDAVMHVERLGTFEGHAGIRRLFEGVPDTGGDGPPAWLRHFTATHQIDVEDEHRARGRCYYAVLMAAGLDHWGRYRDVYERRDGRWLFVERRVSVDGERPGAWSASNLERIQAAGLCD